jgi:hypothetical protein
VSYPLITSAWKVVKMDQEPIYEDFSLKVDEILKCAGHQLVLNAARDLAGGKMANLPDGTVLGLWEAGSLR